MARRADRRTAAERDDEGPESGTAAGWIEEDPLAAHEGQGASAFEGWEHFGGEARGDPAPFHGAEDLGDGEVAAFHAGDSEPEEELPSFTLGEHPFVVLGAEPDDGAPFEDEWEMMPHLVEESPEAAPGGRVPGSVEAPAPPPAPAGAGRDAEALPRSYDAFMAAGQRLLAEHRSEEALTAFRAALSFRAGDPTAATWAELAEGMRIRELCPGAAPQRIPLLCCGREQILSSDIDPELGLILCYVDGMTTCEDLETLLPSVGRLGLYRRLGEAGARGLVTFD